MAILAAWYLSVLSIFLILACILLVLVVLIQRGRGGGLAGAFGGIGGHSVLGARTGDFLTWVTIACATLFILLSIGLNLLTPEEPEPAEAVEQGSDTISAGITLAADPVTPEQGKDVTITLTATAEDVTEIDYVLFVSDGDKDGLGDGAEDAVLGKDNYAPDGWSLKLSTRTWPTGPASIVARVVRFDGTTSGWQQTRLTVQPPATPVPTTTRASPTATPGPAPAAPRTQPAGGPTPDGG